MNAETTNRRSFELVAFAMQTIDKYREDRQRKLLEEAETALSEAVKYDPQYALAAFCSGVTKDLIGKPADAIPFFDRLLKHPPPGDGGSRDEIQYNRGVAWYHQYGHEDLKHAEDDFLEVVTRTRNEGLKMLARTGLAQTYAMWMIPRPAEKARLRSGQAPDVLKFIGEQRTKCLQQVKLVNNATPTSENTTSDLTRSVTGTILNAEGMCEMYWADYNVTGNADKKKTLGQALKLLTQAEEYLPDDWANTCDLASAHMRLADLKRTMGEPYKPEFEQAVSLLESVVHELRPDYGFAYYELGRVYRIWGKFGEAKDSFNKSLAIPEEYRDVSDKTVIEERERADRSDLSFP